MTGRPWEKYAAQPQQAAEAQPAPAGKPWEKYAAQPAQPATAPQGAVNDGKTLSNAPLAMQFLGKGVEGLAGLPGLPLDAMVGGGNFLRRQFDMPEVNLADTPLKDWGSEGWSSAVMGAGNMPKVAAPTNNTERVVQKAGQFLGGGVPFGPAGLLPTATAFAGSEAGRVADQFAPELTHGYGEFAGGVAGGVAGAYKRQPIRTPAPSTDQLKAYARAAYDAADNAGVVFTPQGMQRLGATIDADLAQTGYLPKLQPGIGAVMEEIWNRAQSNVTLKDVDLLRRVAGQAAKSTDPSTRMLASKIIDHLDDFVNNPQQGEVLMGNAQAGAKALGDARRVYAQSAKAQRVEDAVHNAEVQADTTYSGGNIDNATRQKIRPMLMKGNKQNRGWTPDEKAMLRKVARGGGTVQQIARQVGKLSPEGNGLMAQLHLMLAGGGAVSGMGPLGMIPGAVGFVAKRAANAMTKSNVEDLLHTIQRGGTAYQPRTPGRMLTRAAAAAPGITYDTKR